MPSVAIITLGCAKNEVDSERMRARIVAAGMHLLGVEEHPDFVIINTCAFITEATEESVNTIIELADLPEVVSGRCRLMVAGCLPARYGAELAAELPEVTAFVPVEDEPDIADIILAAFSATIPALNTNTVDKTSSTLDATLCDLQPLLDVGRLPESERPWAYLKIAEGCSRHCSYCTIPKIRGPYRSVGLKELLAEADALVACGARELVLIAQDTGLWRDGGLDLSDLLEQLAKRFPDVWLRVLYLQPSAISDRLLKTMLAYPNICRYLDIPLQHASARILKDMNRSGSSQEFLQLLQTIRSALPDVVLRTTVMTGFPGETRQESQELSRFIMEAGFDYVGVFAYSTEQGTIAGERTDQVPVRTRRARAQRLRDIADQIGFDKAEQSIGKQFEVLVTEYEDGLPIGRTQGQAPEADGVVHLDRGIPGERLIVQITESICYDLEARVAE